MFVSKKKYDYAIEALAEAKQSRDDWRGECRELRAELATLKASRARSNENLKLGTAASAKARRKKVEAPSPLDWSKPIEAYHPDGRVVSVDLVRGPDNEGDYKISKNMEDQILGVGSIYAAYYTADGMPSPNVLAEASRWRIRNVA